MLRQNKQVGKRRAARCNLLFVDRRQSLWPISNVAHRLGTVSIVVVNPIFVSAGGSVITTTKLTAYPASKTCQLRNRDTFSSSVSPNPLPRLLHFPATPRPTERRSSYQATKSRARSWSSPPIILHQANRRLFINVSSIGSYRPIKKIFTFLLKF